MRLLGSSINTPTDMQTLEVKETSVMIVRTGSKSLKTTLPEFYVDLLEIRPGDKLYWTHKQDKNTGEYVIEIRKARCCTTGHG